MNNGTCLCGSVTWELATEPHDAYNCYCSMCKKIHGSAFGTYAFVRPDQFKWTSGTDTIIQYKSSPGLTRSSCHKCGSVVPFPSKAHDGWAIPAGCHDHGRKPDCSIFAAGCAPWYEVTDNVPRHDAYPGGMDRPTVDDKPLDEQPDGVIRGSCHCEAIAFHVTEPFKVAHNCHCSRCRRARAAAHASNGFVSMDGVEFLRGEGYLKTYKVPDAKFFTQVFCKVCSSSMPRVDPERGIAVIPLGSLDDDPVVKPVDHIFVSSKADWHEITDDLPTYKDGPPR